MYVLPPENLRVKLDELYHQAYIHQRTWRWSEAVKTYRTIYEILIDNQPQGSRFHKGASLHLLGLALLHVQETSSAIKSFLLAYTEDVLSKSPGEEDGADWEPAGLFLKLHFEVRPALLEVIKKLAHGAKEAKQTIQNPNATLARALAEVEVDEQQITRLCQAIPEIKPRRSLDELRGPWKLRVFIGGSYNQIAILEKIKETVAQAGYDPILAVDFEMPEDLIHHHTLILLHSCKLAVFDISRENGHLMEIERLFDYGIIPLFVYSAMEVSAEPRVSTMLKTRLRQSGFEPQPYRTIDKLCELVREYLGVKDFPVVRSYTEATTTTITEISRKVTATLPPWVEESDNEP